MILDRCECAGGWEVMMNHDEKILYMTKWAKENGCTLVLNGECGFGRECVGILKNEIYPDYEWTNGGDDFERIDNNGDVWIPENAYHKHPCVAVLGRGEHAEAQLYEWLEWFSDNKFVVETGVINHSRTLHPIEILLGKNRYVRMVRKVD